MRKIPMLEERGLRIGIQDLRVTYVYSIRCVTRGEQG